MKPHVLILAAILCQLDNLIAAPLRVIPQRLESNTHVLIDGKLDESVWIDAPRIEKFTQVELNEGGSPSEKTVVKLLYNSDYLYFGIRCYDSEPDKIIAYQLNRDVSLRSDDYVNIVIDTFNNYRSGYFFMINPRGSRSDGFIDKRSSTGHPSRDWDGIWEGEAF